MRNLVIAVAMVAMSAVAYGQSKAIVLSPECESNTWVFLFHDVYGVDVDMKEKAQTIFDQIGDANVVVVDLFDGQTPSRNQSAKVVINNDKAVNYLIVSQLITALDENDRAVFVGWGFGGSWAMKAAEIAGDKALACVNYYGIPNNNLAKFMNINTDVMLITGATDTYANPKVITSFESAMKENGKNIEVWQYETAGGFDSKKSGKYNEFVGSEALTQVIGFIKSKI
jgi:carboxymethylenebutenolidase